MAKLIAGTKVVSDAEAGSLNAEGLPEAGYSREEELKRRCDELEAKIEALTDASRGGTDRLSFDPSKLTKDNEILNYLDQGSYPVLNADDLYVYCWVNRDIHGKFGGAHFYRKKAQGWEICYYCLLYTSDAADE